jgi:NTE family protein
VSRPSFALCLTGGGVTGAMYQIGALAALGDVVEGLDPEAFDLYIGVASGASVAAALAGGAGVRRLYRSLLDPADTYFPLQRSHLLRTDLDEWRRTLVSAWGALRHGSASLWSRTPAPLPNDLWEQLDRFVDSLPAGLFTLDAYERLLAESFLRRGIPNSFRAMPRPLRIPAYDLDAAARVVFGAEGEQDVPVSLACTASMALPLLYSPVRIGKRHFLDGGLGSVAHLDLALDAGADVVVVVHPMVPVHTGGSLVPTGHGGRRSLRDKGALWVYSQAFRVGASARLDDQLARLGPDRERVLVLRPEPTDTTLFLFNPASFANRRTILEYAYRTTRERVERWLSERPAVAERAGWRLAR